MEYNLIRSSHRSIARRPARHIFSSACRGFSRIGTGHRLLFRAEKEADHRPVYAALQKMLAGGTKVISDWRPSEPDSSASFLYTPLRIVFAQTSLKRTMRSAHHELHR